MDGNFDNENNVGKSYGYYGDKIWFADSDNDSIKTVFPTDTWIVTDLKIREASASISADGSNPGSCAKGSIAVKFADTADGGDFASDATYKFGYTLLYQSHGGGISEFAQESNLTTLQNLNNTLNVGADDSSITMTIFVNTGAQGGEYPQVNEEGVSVTGTFDPRVIGCRIYWVGDSTGAYDDPFMMGECYFGSSSNDPPYFISHDGNRDDTAVTVTLGSDVTASMQVTVKSIPAITYGINNVDYDPDDHTYARYSTVAIVGSHAYIGNIKRESSPPASMEDLPEDKRVNDVMLRAQHDRIIRSSFNRFDTFPQDNYIDVATNDGDQLVALIGF